MSYKSWLDVVKKIQTHQAGIPIYSPECPGEEVCYKYIGNTESRYGYLIAWCNASKKGINISRLKIPEGVNFTSIDLPEEQVNEGVPDDIDFVSPADNN